MLKLLKKFCPLVLFTQVLFIYAPKAGGLLFFCHDYSLSVWGNLSKIHVYLGNFTLYYRPVRGQLRAHSYFNSSQVNRHYIPGLFLFQFINGHLSCFRLLRTVSRLMCFYDFSGKSLISPKYVFIMLVLRNEEFNLFC